MRLTAAAHQHLSNLSSKLCKSTKLAKRLIMLILQKLNKLLSYCKSSLGALFAQKNGIPTRVVLSISFIHAITLSVPIALQPIINTNIRITAQCVSLQFIHSLLLTFLLRQKVLPSSLMFRNKQVSLNMQNQILIVLITNILKLKLKI